MITTSNLYSFQGSTLFTMLFASIPPQLSLKNPILSIHISVSISTNSFTISGHPIFTGFSEDHTTISGDLWGAFGPYQGPVEFGIGNGLEPSHIMGYLKWDFDARPQNGRLGWIQPVQITQNQKINVPSFELGPKTNKLFKIDVHPSRKPIDGEAREFFLIENRKQNVWSDL